MPVVQQPLTRLRVLQKPFKHITARYGNEELLQAVLREFPAPDWEGWHVHRAGGNALKKSSRGVLAGPASEAVVESLSSESFLKFLAQALEIERPLLVDDTREGGGLHFIEEGGFLGMHADFNKGPDGLDRRVNLLLYLNHDWLPDEGGCLELGADRSIAYPPEFGMVVAFPTRDDTFHGHPVPVTRERKSIALYYYTQGRPEREKSRSHCTLYIGGREER